MCIYHCNEKFVGGEELHSFLLRRSNFLGIWLHRREYFFFKTSPIDQLQWIIEHESTSAIIPRLLWPTRLKTFGIYHCNKQLAKNTLRIIQKKMFLPKKNHTNQWQIFFSTSKSAPIHVFWTIGSNRTTYANARDHPANSITEQDDENIHVRPRLRPECSPLKLACARRSFFFWIWWADREHACAGRAGEELIVQQVVKGTVIRLRPLMERGTVCFTACGALALSTQWCFIWANGGECRSGVQDLVGITMSCHTPLPAPTLFIHLYPVIRVRLAAFCAIVDVLVIVSKDENVNEGRCVSIKL